MRFSEKYFLLSSPGNGRDDVYRVINNTYGGEGGVPETGCFVLRPSKEKEAFLALKFFFQSLDPSDERYEELKTYTEQLAILWGIREDEE